jgi:hypothetical protein
MKRLRSLTFATLALLLAPAHAAQTPPAAAPGTPAPVARTPADGPVLPAAALPGGLVLALYPPDSPLLKRERLHEVGAAERGLALGFGVRR